MLRLLTSVCLCLFAATCFSEDRIEKLPSPQFHAQATDPAWLRYAVQLHGHLGPMLTFGARMGMAAVRAVEANGYFDVEITCEGPFAKPPASCFLDGLQISTGATLGKRNLQWVEGKKIVIHVKNTRTGKTATLEPRAEFLRLLPKTDAKEDATSGKPSQPGDDHIFDGLARKIAAMPEKEILTVQGQQRGHD
jgi:formylmethanofuran dehydrogenase subunit E